MKSKCFKYYINVFNTFPDNITGFLDYYYNTLTKSYSNSPKFSYAYVNLDFLEQ